MSGHLQCESLSKHYSGIKALDGLDLSLEINQATGIVGPNGAGKSTLFSILCGFIKPSTGKVTVLGNRPDAASNRGQLSLLPQDTAMYKGIEVNRQLLHYTRLQGLTKKDAVKEVQHVIERVNANDFAKQYPETLSFGQRKRVMLAQSLIGHPKLILMDEPTSGLDPVAATEVRRILQQLAQEYSLVISSHNLNEIEDICSDIVILKKGKLVSHNKLSELTRNQHCFSLKLEQSTETPLDEILKDIQGISTIESVLNDGKSWHVYYDNIAAEQLQIRILSVLGEKNISVAELRKGKALADEVSGILKSRN